MPVMPHMIAQYCDRPFRVWVSLGKLSALYPELPTLGGRKRAMTAGGKGKKEIIPK